jgi:hypothetical protein
MTADRRALTLVACGAGPAVALRTCVKLAQDRDWTVRVMATPAALDFFDATAIADQTGSPVRRTDPAGTGRLPAVPHPAPAAT